MFLPAFLIEYYKSASQRAKGRAMQVMRATVKMLRIFIGNIYNQRALRASSFM